MKSPQKKTFRLTAIIEKATSKVNNGIFYKNKWTKLNIRIVFNNNFAIQRFNTKILSPSESINFLNNSKKQMHFFTKPYFVRGAYR